MVHLFWSSAYPRTSECPTWRGSFLILLLLFHFHVQESWVWSEPLAESPASLHVPYNPEVWLSPWGTTWGTPWSSLPLTGWHLPFLKVKQSVSPISASRTPLSFWKVGHLHFSELGFFPNSKKQLYLQAASFFFSEENFGMREPQRL